jgi:hypothetical protein
MLLSRLSNAELEDLMSDKRAPKPRSEPSEILLRRCAVCHEYAPAGSLAEGASRCCHATLTPR